MMNSYKILKIKMTQDPKIIVVACFPKSGSTFLTRKLAELPHSELSPLVPVGERREQELDECIIRNVLAEKKNLNIIGHQHLRLNINTANLARKFNIQFVVLIRSIMDCIVSLRDHMMNESMQFPTSYWTRSLYDELKNSKLSILHALTITNVPWFINFYLSWHFWENEYPHIAKPIFLSYDKIFADPEKTLFSLSSELNMGSSLQDIRNVLKQDTFSRFNIGKSGRGKEAFIKDEPAMNALNNLLNCYPNVDFSPIH